MDQNNEYQNVKEEEPYYDDLKQTKIPRRGKFCFKTYNLWTRIYVETVSGAILNLKVKQ